MCCRLLSALQLRPIVIGRLIPEKPLQHLRFAFAAAEVLNEGDGELRPPRDSLTAVRGGMTAELDGPQPPERHKVQLEVPLLGPSLVAHRTGKPRTTKHSVAKAFRVAGPEVAPFADIGVQAVEDAAQARARVALAIRVTIVQATCAEKQRVRVFPDFNGHDPARGEHLVDDELVLRVRRPHCSDPVELKQLSGRLGIGDVYVHVEAARRPRLHAHVPQARQHPDGGAEAGLSRQRPGGFHLERHPRLLGGWRAQESGIFRAQCLYAAVALELPLRERTWVDALGALRHVLNCSAPSRVEGGDELEFQPEAAGGPRRQVCAHPILDLCGQVVHSRPDARPCGPREQINAAKPAPFGSNREPLAQVWGAALA
mmetsp:Transcript_32988/g.99668  ORF Transcript_32988/g.99668 Transcript_32988/m.99668 type:complete len:371 (+) Transcript_32988:451-1563(+)